MAQNVTVNGANYAGVPAVALPLTAGGTAKFMDTSDATAGAGDILRDKTAYSGGAKLVGTAIAGNPLTITVTVDTGAAVSATDGTNTVAGTSTNGSCVLTVPNAGTWTVSATLNGRSTSESISVTTAYSLTMAIVSSTLNNNDWSIISSISNDGIGSNYWSIGDCKSVALSGTVGKLTFSETYYAFIIGFNHNSSYEGSNRIHFMFAKTAQTGGIDVAFTDTSYGGTIGGFCMNTTRTNAGGWKSSYIRTSICGTSLSSYTGTFIGVLPSALRSVLKSTTKYTDNTGNSTMASAVTSTTDYIFLLSEYEVLGSIIHANTNEAIKQAQYAYYSAGNSKIKYRHKITTSGCEWWFRSPKSSTSNGFVCAWSDGTAVWNYADYSVGFAPCFCV